MTTERFRPSPYDQTFTDKFGIEAFYSNEQLCAIFYIGKQTKHLWHFKFKDKERMMYAIHSAAKEYVQKQEKKLAKQAENKAMMSEFKASDHFAVGDIVVNTWGWEQTNVEFYQVTDVLNKKIRVKQIHGLMVEGSMMSHGMACEVTPVCDNFMESGDEYLLSLKLRSPKEVIICSPESYYYFHKWNGKPLYKSWYA